MQYKQALQVAIDQLNGVLNTPAVDLQEAQAQIATLENTAEPAVEMTPPAQMNTVTEATAA